MKPISIDEKHALIFYAGAYLLVETIFVVV